VVSVRVIGCGNLLAGDDAAGILAARRLKSELAGMRGLDVVEVGPPLAILDLLDDVDAVLLLDAVRSPRGGRPPGEIVRAETGADGTLPAEVGASLSSHGVGLGEAVSLAAALGRTKRVVFVGVEAADLETGHPLSPPVAAAMPRLVRTAVSEASRLGEPHPG
jgi:hydrogenase maturation protease